MKQNIISMEVWKYGMKAVNTLSALRPNPAPMLPDRALRNQKSQSKAANTENTTRLFCNEHQEPVVEAGMFLNNQWEQLEDLSERFSEKGVS